MSELQTIDFSIVFVAQNHNPSIINPDFLERNDIVLEEWDWKVDRESTFSTPQASHVEYDSSVTIAIDQNKAIIKDLTFGLDPMDSKILKMAREFVEVLPHVNYVGLGINFESGFEHEQPADFLRKQFFSDQDFEYNQKTVQNVGTKFVYNIENGQVTYDIDPGTVTAEDDEGNQEHYRGVIIDSNFHREITDPDEPVEELQNFINNSGDDWEEYKAFYQTFFPEALNNAS